MDAQSCKRVDTEVYRFLDGSECVWSSLSSTCDTTNFPSTLFMSPPADSSTADSCTVLANPLRSRSRSRDDQNGRSPEHNSKLPKKTPEDKVKVVIMNCQSICNEAAELEAFIDSIQPDIMIATGSGLTPDIMSEVYITFRRERAFGGMKSVFLQVSNKLVCSTTQVDDTNCELTFILIDPVGSPKLVLGAFYCNRSSNTSPQSPYKGSIRC